MLYSDNIMFDYLLWKAQLIILNRVANISLKNASKVLLGIL